jgi:site-specific DNA recombinase
MADDLIRLAFWGRVSTEDNQDPESSRAWQLTRARTLIEPHGGQIVTEFFDVDKSRSIPPQRRPEAVRLLTALADPGRGFDAVVVGEPQRAFYGNQFGNTFPLFAHYGVPLWVPEVGGPIDPDNEAHDLIMNVFGGVSKGERNRIKIRVRAAMAAQAQLEGRFLGGRPPYGYRLADAGPHPNPAKAADGKRLHRLAIDESAAEVVRRIFRDFVAGRGIFAIAELLTAGDIPSPSAHDPDRNPHRCGLAWSKSAVRAILLNPRYTGRQVWNRQRKDEVLIDVADVALGHTTKQRWNDPDQWIYSDQPVHPPIISDGTFAQAQAMLAAKNDRQVVKRPRSSPRPYILRGLLHCGICDRRMQGTWNNSRTYYRCMFPAQYALASRIDHPRTVYLREAEVVPELDDWLATTLDPAHLHDALDDLADAARLDQPSPEAAALREEISSYDLRIAQYRAALDNRGDPAVLGPWITETQARKLAAEVRLRACEGASTRPRRITREEIAAIVNAIADLMSLLPSADPSKKSVLYAGAGLCLTYNPVTQPKTVTVRAEVSRSCTQGSCPRGDTTHNPWVMAAELVIIAGARHGSSGGS